MIGPPTEMEKEKQRETMFPSVSLSLSSLVLFAFCHSGRSIVLLVSRYRASCQMADAGKIALEGRAAVH